MICINIFSLFSTKTQATYKLSNSTKKGVWLQQCHYYSLNSLRENPFTLAICISNGIMHSVLFPHQLQKSAKIKQRFQNVICHLLHFTPNASSGASTTKTPAGPRWAPCWPHEPCYRGSDVASCLLHGHPFYYCFVHLCQQYIGTTTTAVMLQSIWGNCQVMYSSHLSFNLNMLFYYEQTLS